MLQRAFFVFLLLESKGIIDNIMKASLRLTFAIVMFVVSLGVLAWSFLPGARIVRRQEIQPIEMQLPAQTDYFPFSNKTLSCFCIDNASHAINGVALFVLLI